MMILDIITKKLGNIITVSVFMKDGLFTNDIPQYD